MGRALYVAGALVVLLGLVLGACAKATPTPPPAATPTPAPAKVYKLNFSHFGTPEPGPRWQLSLKYAELVKKNTKGAVEIEVFPAGQLTKVAETMTAISKGALDGAFHPDAYIIGMVPWGQWGTLGMASPETVYDIYREVGLFDKMNAGLMKNNIYSMGFYSPGEIDAVFHRKKFIEDPTELKGMMMRSFGGTWDKIIEALGAGLITIPSAEAYTAFQRGTADGTISVTVAAYGFKWHEVVPYWTYIPTLGGPYAVHYLINLGKWNELPPDLQQAMLKSARELEPIAIKDRAEWNADILNKAQAEGAKVKTPDPEKWLATVRPLAEKHFKAVGPENVAVWDAVAAWHKKTGR